MQKTYDDCYLICSTAVYFENHVSLRMSGWPGSHYCMLTADRGFFYTLE